MTRLTDLLRGAIELNLKYTSTLLHLSKDYMKDVGDMVARSDPTAAGPTETAPTTPPRVPLLIVGSAGETGSAAFSVNNSSDRAMRANFEVTSELTGERITLLPSELDIPAATRAIVRIVVRFDKRMEAERDFAGSVAAPGLSNEAVPFVVRRLADEIAPGASPGENGPPKKRP